jgi:hypothetical protein
MTSMTIIIAPAMKAKTPVTPKLWRNAAMTNEEKTAEKRLYKYTKLTARARMPVGNSCC